jgi:uncharacterized protein YndB with AHSA1/START domain
MKWLLLIVAIAVVVIGGVAVIGATLPQDHIVSRSAKLSAPPDSVWSIITNVTAYPTWRKDLDRVEPVPGATRRTWREISGRDKMTYEATAEEPPHHFVSRIAEKGSFGGTWDYEIVPDGTGSKITITEHGEVYNPVFRFMSTYVMGQTATLDKYLTALTARTGDRYTAGAA